MGYVYGALGWFTISFAVGLFVGAFAAYADKNDLR